jgi:hypothetical protein
MAFASCFMALENKFANRPKKLMELRRRMQIKIMPRLSERKKKKMRFAAFSDAVPRQE